MHKTGLAAAIDIVSKANDADTYFFLWRGKLWTSGRPPEQLKAQIRALELELLGLVSYHIIQFEQSAYKMMAKGKFGFGQEGVDLCVEQAGKESGFTYALEYWRSMREGKAH
jgi:hypothetical protein